MSVAVASLAVFAASQIGTPGPANMAMLATGARFGFAGAFRFMLGVLFGKQLIIWPVGFGLMALAVQAPLVFAMLKWASAAYICWLAWKIANLRLNPAAPATRAPGFLAGLVVHPLNPKAWAMITSGFANFVAPGTPALTATATLAVLFFAIQAVFHPLWTIAGDRIAATLAGTRAETYLMWTLAGLTVASVVFVLVLGGGQT